MDIAIVTGASSSLGLAIARRLIQLGFRVYGLGGDYTDCPLQNVNFRPMPCNLDDPQAVTSAAHRILEKEKSVCVLVNNAKFFGNKAFWEMDPQEIERVIRINLLCPLLLSRIFADSLATLQGYVIQLGSLTVEASRGGPVGAAAAGGLKWMSEVLFQDLREHGVKVCHISPEPNRSRDPRTTAKPGARVTSTIDPEAVAQAVEQVLQNPFGNVVTEMILRPLRVKEPEHDPVVHLPYPEPKPVPYTVPREMIEAEEQLEEEEFQENQRRKRERRRSKPTDDERAGKPRPKREEKPAPRDEQDRKPSREEPGREISEKQEPQPRSGRRRSRRKPKPPKIEVGFQKKPDAEGPGQPGTDGSREARHQQQPGAKSDSSRQSVQKPAPSPSASDKPAPDGGTRAAAESPDKPPATKAARKRPSKKTPAKKSTRKSAAKKVSRKPASKAAVVKDDGSAVKKTPRKRPARKAAKPAPSENKDA